MSVNKIASQNIQALHNARKLAFGREPTDESENIHARVGHSLWGGPKLQRQWGLGLNIGFCLTFYTFTTEGKVCSSGAYWFHYDQATRHKGGTDKGNMLLLYKRRFLLLKL